MELHIYVYSYINIFKDSIEFEQMSATPKVKIYHNPECGTSRNTLALIRNANIEPEVIEYLKNPPSKNELIQMIADAGLTRFVRMLNLIVISSWAVRTGRMNSF